MPHLLEGLKTDKEISENEMKNIFKGVNRLLDPYRENEEEFPISYEQGLNIDTLMEGVELCTNGKVQKLLSNAGKLGNIENFFVIEQWQ